MNKTGTGPSVRLTDARASKTLAHSSAHTAANSREATATAIAPASP